MASLYTRIILALLAPSLPLTLLAGQQATLTKEQEYNTFIQPLITKTRKKLADLQKSAEKAVADAETVSKKSEQNMNSLVREAQQVRTHYIQQAQDFRREKGLPTGAASAEKDWSAVTVDFQSQSAGSQEGEAAGNDFEKLLARMQGRIAINIEDKIIRPTQRMADIVAETSAEKKIKNTLQEFIDLLSPDHPKQEEYRRWGSKPPRSLILKGMPGIGKTHLLNAMAGELSEKNIPCIRISGSDLISHNGESARNITEIFKSLDRYADECGLKNIVIIIDDADEILTSRHIAKDAERVGCLFATLDAIDKLREKDNVKVCVTSNYDLDKAFEDRGIVILASPPSASSRERYLITEFQKRVNPDLLTPTELKECAKFIAARSEGHSYRNLDHTLTTLCNHAANTGQQKLTADWVKKYVSPAKTPSNKPLLSIGGVTINEGMVITLGLGVIVGCFAGYKVGHEEGRDSVTLVDLLAAANQGK